MAHRQLLKNRDAKIEKVRPSPIMPSNVNAQTGRVTIAACHSHCPTSLNDAAMPATASATIKSAQRPRAKAAHPDGATGLHVGDVIVVVGSRIDIGDPDVELGRDDRVPGLVIGNQAAQVASSTKAASVLLLFFPLKRATRTQARMVAGGLAGGG
jgi:hypothetical protein